MRNAHPLFTGCRVTFLCCTFGSRGKSFRTPSHKKRNFNKHDGSLDGLPDSEMVLSSDSNSWNAKKYDSTQAEISTEHSQNELEIDRIQENGLNESDESEDPEEISTIQSSGLVEVSDDHHIEAYSYDKDGAPVRPSPKQKDHVQLKPPIPYERENTEIERLVQAYTSMFGSPLEFDLLYLENTSRRGVEHIDADKNITVSEITTKIDMIALLDKLLQNDCDKITAFLCYRKEFVTELELHYCIPILAKQPQFFRAIEKHPDLIGLLTEQLSNLQLGSLDSAAVLLKEVASLYEYTTPPEVLVNFLGQFATHVTSHLFFPDGRPTFVPSIEDLVRQGHKPRPEQLAPVEEFYRQFMQHLLQPALRKSSHLTMSAELEAFVHHMFYAVRLCSIEQALRLLEIFYSSVVANSDARKNVTLDSTEAEGDFVLLDTDRMANLPIIEALDVFLSEHILQLTLEQTARVLFVLIRSGRFDCVFGQVLHAKLQQLETIRLAKAKGIIAQAGQSSNLAEAAQNYGQDVVLRTLGTQLQKAGAQDFAAVFQLIWSLSHVKQQLPEIEAAVWMHLEALLLRSVDPSILVLSPPQISILISSFFNKGFGSDSLWSQFMTYIKLHPKSLSISLRCLVFHSLLTRGLLRSKIHGSNFKIFVHQIQNFGTLLWDFADSLSRDEDNPSAAQRLKIVMNLIMFAHLSGIQNGFATFELANRVRSLLQRSIARKLVGDEPILMVAVTKIVHETLKAEFQTLIKRHGQDSKEIALRQEDLHGWTSFARVLYYLERKMENFTMICPLMVYIYLGRSYLELAPIAAKLSKSDQEPLLDDLTVKRRVLYHQVQEMCKGVDPWTSLMALEVCLVEDYMDDKLLQHLVFKLSAALDNYTLDQVITVGLGLKYFGISADHPFFELFPAVIEMLVDELPEESLLENSNLRVILREQFPTLSFPNRLPTTDVAAKAGSLLHSIEAYELILKRPEARKHIMDYYWIFIAESGAGAVNHAVERVVSPPEQEVKQFLADMPYLTPAISG